MTATKKCPHCGRWTEWSQQPTDRCQHCGQVLEPYRVASEEARQKLSEQPLSSVMLIEIKPDDGPVVRFFKYIIRGGQLAFAAIMAFIVWLVTVLAG
ncbi:putative amidophosphoribosyltransferase [Hymenobacter luteus]|uniref:Amidophosphoribosyltransferase n=2 Tax=Hymenobacter TaxID=89966 RepID=A0ABR6JZK2_9BACT|nr:MULTISPECIES: hypothetical protein [Hymenobacter]MBB4601693.1 putative amidophosphoribosyltransferase [Hymenobacter latericoloratus]MBB6059879.1 putative amidophosphoribosyltransferase [Hymenobacter luteus]